MKKLSIRDKIKTIKKLTIMGETLKFKLVKTIRENGKPVHAMAAYCEARHTIYFTKAVLEDENEDRNMRIFWHELAHAIWHETPLRNLDLGDSMEEVIVDTIGMCIRDVLKSIL